jgi:hypothetical protein
MTLRLVVAVSDLVQTSDNHSHMPTTLWEQKRVDLQL